MVGIVPLSELLFKYLQSRRKEQQSRFRTQETPFAASVPTHSSVSNNSWPTVLGIVPVSRLLCKYLQKSTKSPGQTNENTRRHNSQMLKQ
jgi:hypothetical protein